jgi:hypothetical protein
MIFRWRNFTRWLQAACVVGLAGASGACSSDNAILEVRLALPSADTSPLFAVSVAEGGAGNAPRFTGGRMESQPLTGGASELRLEIVAEGSEIKDPMELWVAFCKTAACEGETVLPSSGAGGDASEGDAGDGAGNGADETRAPVLKIRFERAFYTLKRTDWQGEAPPISILRASDGPLEIDVDRCDIQGCRGGEATSWCRLDGTHFCEAP